MNILNSERPAKEAGDHITKIIQQSGRDVMCLLAGGSAFEIVKHIQLPALPECRTIFMMGDERVSRGITENNFLQLENMYLGYRILEHTIKTVPEENETRVKFAERIGVEFLQQLTELNNPLIIALMGIGTDGHTAGIFPMEREQFAEVYRDDATYVPVYLEGLEIDSRTTFTPTWLLGHVDEMIGYASGEEKTQIMDMLITEQKQIHERPAELLKLHKNAYLYTDLQTSAS